MKTLLSRIHYKYYELSIITCETSQKLKHSLYYCIENMEECCLTESAAALSLGPVAYRTFCKYWQDLLPHVIISKPRCDLCWTCQQNSTAIMKVTNRSDHEKERVFSYSGNLQSDT